MKGCEDDVMTGLTYCELADNRLVFFVKSLQTEMPVTFLFRGVNPKKYVHAGSDDARNCWFIAPTGLHSFLLFTDT